MEVKLDYGKYVGKWVVKESEGIKDSEIENVIVFKNLYINQYDYFFYIFWFLFFCHYGNFVNK